MNENQFIKWYSPTREPFRLYGLPFFEMDGIYRRLQLNPPEPIPEMVNTLANNTAGVQVHVRGKLQKLILKAKLYRLTTSDHMTAIGRSGFDCYLKETGGIPRYFSSTRFNCSSDNYEYVLIDIPEPREFNIMINFPLYSAVNEVLFGVNENAILSEPDIFVDNGRIVIYGTSVTQGACASRPGMAHTNILSRRLNREVVNLGFSGSGKCEAEMALAIREIERTSLLIIETEANCPGATWIAEKYPKFIQLYREKWPTTPILVVSRPMKPQALIIDEQFKVLRDKANIQKKVVEECRDKGDNNIYFCNGSDFLGSDFDECTVEGVHLSDLGFIRMADSLQPVIERILGI
jgi:hypothetical protein